MGYSTEDTGFDGMNEYEKEFITKQFIQRQEEENVKQVSVFKIFSKIISGIFVATVFLFMNIVIVPELIFVGSTAHVFVGVFMLMLMWGWLAANLYVWFVKHIKYMKLQ